MLTVLSYSAQINEAYNILSDASRRHEYDVRLGKAGSSSSSRTNPFGSVPNHRYHYFADFDEENLSGNLIASSNQFKNIPIAVS